MFRRNRALQVTMVKTPKNETPTDSKEECTHVDPEEIAKIAKDFVTHTAKAACAVIVTYAVSTAVTQIAVKLTSNKEDQ